MHFIKIIAQAMTRMVSRKDMVPSTINFTGTPKPPARAPPTEESNNAIPTGSFRKKQLPAKMTIISRKISSSDI